MPLTNLHQLMPLTRNHRVLHQFLYCQSCYKNCSQAMRKNYNSNVGSMFEKQFRATKSYVYPLTRGSRHLKNYCSRTANHRFPNFSYVMRTFSFTIKVYNDENIYMDTLKKDPKLQEILKELKDDFSSISKEPSESDTSADTLFKESLYEDVEEFEDSDEFEEEIEIWKPPVELIRGRTGVFEIEELMTVLHEENVKDICVLRVPQTYHYVDYMVIGSVRSFRHLRAAAENVKFIHKRKKDASDHYLKIEGLDGRDWIAMDLGNIALHLFMPDVRAEYDLETLWSVGQKYDEQCKQVDDPYTVTWRPKFPQPHELAEPS